MKTFTLILISFILIGCSEQKDKKPTEITVVSALDIIKEDREKAASFILQCAKNANPLSDEEGEDLVKQCDRTADGIYGVQRYKICTGKCWSNFKWCDDVTLANEIKACKNNGWVLK